MNSDEQRWMVVVNMRGVTKPIRMIRKTWFITSRKYWGSVDDHWEFDAEKRPGCTMYLFKEKKDAATFYKGTQAVFSALKYFME